LRPRRMRSIAHLRSCARGVEGQLTQWKYEQH
jgi:hypothetical protein